MSGLPKPKTNADGLIEVPKSILPEVKTQEQADATSLYNKAYNIDPIKAKQIIDNAKEHPELSAGVAVSMGLNDILPGNPIAQKLAYINQTFTQAEKDKQKKEAQAKEDKAFQSTPWGSMWTGIKAAARTMTTVAFLPLEYTQGLTRGYESMYLKATGGLEKDQTSKYNVNPLNNFLQASEQTTFTQAIHGLFKDGKLNLGSGFFPDQTAGAGFAARKAQADVLGVNVYDPKTKELIGVRPYAVYGDPTAYVLTNGRPDSEAGKVISATAEIAALFGTDPMLIFGKSGKLARQAEIREKVAQGVSNAQGFIERQEKLAEARKAAQELSDKLKRSEDSLKKNDLTRAELIAERNRGIWQARSRDAVEANIALRTGDVRVSEWFNAQSKVAERKQIVERSKATYEDLFNRRNATSALERTTKAVEDIKAEISQTKIDLKAIKEAGKVPNTLYLQGLEKDLSKAQEEFAQAQKAAEGIVPVSANEVAAAKQALQEARKGLRAGNTIYKEKGQVYREAAENARITARAREEAAKEFIKSEKVRKTTAQKVAEGTATRDEILKAYADTLEKEAGLKDSFIENPLDYSAMQEYLTYGSGRTVIQQLADVENWRDIWRMTKYKMPVDACVDIAAAKTADEVANVIARYVKTHQIAPGVMRSVEDTVAVKGFKGAQAWASNNRPLLNKTGAHFLDAMNNTKVGRGFNDILKVSKGVVDITGERLGEIKRRYNAIMPHGAFLDIRDTETLLRAVDNYATVLRLPEEVTNKILDKIAFAASDSERGYAASAELFEEIFKHHIGKISPELQESFRQATEFFKSRQQGYTNYWASRHVNGADVEFIGIGGKKVVLPGPQLDSELLNAQIYLPSPTEMLRLTSKMRSYALVKGGTKVLDSLISDFWKKTVLVRPAFVLRNIAEEQLRVFGVGHIGFFNHPAAAIAMWLGRPSGSATRQLLNSFNKYRNTVFGDDMKGTSVEQDFLDEVLGRKLAHGYIDLMSDETRGAYGTDEKVKNILSVKGIGVAAFGHKRFFDGVANQLRLLNASDIARVVAGATPAEVFKYVANGLTREEAVVKYFLEGGGKASYSRFANSKTSEVRDWLLSENGAMEYLYTGANEEGLTTSVFARIKELTADNEALKSLISKGKADLVNGSIKLPTAADDASIALTKQGKTFGKKKIMDANQILAAQLRENFSNLEWGKTQVNIPARLHVADMRAERSWLNNFVDGFFEKATAFEKTTTMGPEYQQAYWDAINLISSSLNEAAKATLRETALKSLNKLEDSIGRPLGKNHPVWSAFERAGKGPVTLEDAHTYADNAARMHVKELFYNAHERKLLFHSVRLLFPFAQAWADTLGRWAEIGVKNPLQVYKGMQMMNWLQSPQSSALYLLTDAADYYDPNQGFFFKNPQSGEQMFWVPFAGTILTKMIDGLDSKGAPIAFSANPMSFNFALGTGSILPAFGPVLTYPTSLLATFDKNKSFVDNMPPALRDWIFPFGPSDFSSGPLSAILPQNWTRILGGLAGQEETYASSFRPTMAYLASSGSYSNTPEDQNRLVKDTDHFARWFGVMRGVVGLFSPMPLTPQGLGKDQNGDVTTQLALYNDFQAILNSNNGDWNGSMADFFDLYGPEAVYAIINNYKGQGPSNSATAELLNKYPDIADKYPDTFGFVMPGGSFSASLRKWNLLTGRKAPMTATDIKNKATELLYYAARDRLLARAATEGWNKTQFSNAKSALQDRFNGGPVTTFDPNKQARDLDQLRRMSEDSRFVNEPTMQSLRDYLYLRDAAIEARGKATLKGSGSVAQREWLADMATKIMKQDPSFSLIFNYFFANELEG